MNNILNEFRFAYFTNKYKETCDFYAETLGFKLLFSWDRDGGDKGAVFKAGGGKVEILQLPGNEEELQNAGIDYRAPQGAFMVIQVNNVDALYTNYKAKGLNFKQHLTNQSWGHRSFSITDPNGVVLFMWEGIN